MDRNEVKNLLERIAGKYDLCVVEKEYLSELNPYIVKLKDAIRKIYRINDESKNDYNSVAAYCAAESNHMESLNFSAQALGVSEANTVLYRVLEEFDLEDILEEIGVYG